MQFTRGYYSGQVTGDNALATTAELQLNTALDFSALHLPADMSTQFYVFYDWGQTWNNQSDDPAVHISSAGGGMRMQAHPRAELDLEGLARFNRIPDGYRSRLAPVRGRVLLAGPGAVLIEAPGGDQAAAPARPTRRMVGWRMDCGDPWTGRRRSGWLE